MNETPITLETLPDLIAEYLHQAFDEEGNVKEIGDGHLYILLSLPEDGGKLEKLLAKAGGEIVIHLQTTDILAQQQMKEILATAKNQQPNPNLPNINEGQ